MEEQQWKASWSKIEYVNRNAHEAVKRIHYLAKCAYNGLCDKDIYQPDKFLLAQKHFRPNFHKDVILVKRALLDIKAFILPLRHDLFDKDNHYQTGNAAVDIIAYMEENHQGKMRKDPEIMDPFDEEYLKELLCVTMELAAETGHATARIDDAIKQGARKIEGVLAKPALERAPEATPGNLQGAKFREFDASITTKRFHKPAISVDYATIITAQTIVPDIRTLVVLFNFMENVTDDIANYLDTRTTDFFKHKLWPKSEPNNKAEKNKKRKTPTWISTHKHSNQWTKKLAAELTEDKEGEKDGERSKIMARLYKEDGSYDIVGVEEDGVDTIDKGNGTSVRVVRETKKWATELP
jgi:hypothetical protein